MIIKSGQEPKVVENKARQDEPEPGHTDRQRAEMAHVGVERLGPGHGKDDGT